MPRTHMRVVGSAGGNECGGVSGNAKSRRLYPASQGTEFCMRKMWRVDGKHEVRCKKPQRCKSCLMHSNYTEERIKIKKGKDKK